MKKQRLLLISILLLQSCANESSLVSSESVSSQTSSSSIEELASSSSKEVLQVSIVCEDILDVDIHTKKQRSYLEGPVDDIATYGLGGKELSKPKSTKITWTSDDSTLPVKYRNQFKGFKLHLYEDENRSNQVEFETTDNSVNVSNLYLDHTYYYDVTAYFGELEFRSNLAKLVTSDSIIRNLDIDGVTNCRDLGNYPTKFNKKTKQGMIYRSAKFNANYSINRLITSAGIDTVVNTLKLKTEIDLRNVYKSLDLPENNENGSLTYSVIGDSVTYKQIDYSYYASETFDDLYDEPNKSGAYKFFKTLADINNYPIDFHCSIGTDRTGYLSFLTLALLGVSEENLYRDYLFSNFANIGSSRAKTNITNYLVKKLNKLEGEDMTEKVENYLLSINITKEEIDTIREIMLV